MTPAHVSWLTVLGCSVLAFLLGMFVRDLLADRAIAAFVEKAKAEEYERGYRAGQVNLLVQRANVSELRPGVAR